MTVAGRDCYWCTPSRCPMASLPELLDIISDMRVEFPCQFVLWVFNVPAAATSDKTGQDFVASAATMGLSQQISGPMHQGGCTLDLLVCSGQTYSEMKMGGVIIASLSCSDHCLVSFRLTGPPCLLMEGRGFIFACPWRLKGSCRFLEFCAGFSEQYGR